MASILSKNLTVKNGQVIQVKNENRKSFSNEANTYYALWVKEANEHCLLFTEKEFNKCEKLLGTFCEDFDLGKVYTFQYTKTKNSAKRYLINVIHINGDKTCLMLTEKLLNTVIKRGNKNIEDQPEKSWWIDLTD